jgi:hypothetical protein
MATNTNYIKKETNYYYIHITQKQQRRFRKQMVNHQLQQGSVPGIGEIIQEDSLRGGKFIA